MNIDNSITNNHISLCFIGCGGWARRKYLPFLKEEAGVEVVAFCELVMPEEREEVLQLFPSARYYDTTQEMLAAEKLDGAIVTLPHSLHISRILMCLEQGVTVFTDKPAGISADEVGTIIAAAKKANRPVAVGCQRRAFPGLTKLKTRLHQLNQTPRWITGSFHFPSYPQWQNTWRNNPTLSGNPIIKQGVLLDTGYHLIDSVLYLLDFPKPKHVFAQANYRDYQVEADAFVTIQFESELTAHLSISRDCPAQHELEALSVLTDESFISFERKPTTTGDSQTLYSETLNEQSTIQETLTIGQFAQEPLKGFLRMLAGSSPESQWLVESSVTTMQALDAAYQSIQTGSVVSL